MMGDRANQELRRGEPRPERRGWGDGGIIDSITGSAPPCMRRCKCHVVGPPILDPTKAVTVAHINLNVGLP